jgi:RNA 3'-terminal phosphate cyclase (ATP)
VAEDAVQQAAQYLAAGVPVGPCLADQLLIPLALAGAGAFTTQALTRHASTNIDVIRRFVDVEIETEQTERDRWTVRVGSSATRAAMGE